LVDICGNLRRINRWSELVDPPEIVWANLAIDQFTSNLDRFPTTQNDQLAAINGNFKALLLDARYFGSDNIANIRGLWAYLLKVPEGSRGSWLDKLRSGPTRVSGPAVRAGIDRLKSVRELGITLPAAARIPESRIAALARFANRAKVTLITRLPPARRLATLAAFVPQP
jgi:hypothetical protein